MLRPVIRRRETKSVIEALIMAYNVHEEDVCSHKVGTHRRILSGPRGQTGEVDSIMEVLE